MCGAVNGLSNPKSSQNVIFTLLMCNNACFLGLCPEALRLMQHSEASAEQQAATRFGLKRPQPARAAVHTWRKHQSILLSLVCHLTGGEAEWEGGRAVVSAELKGC